MMAFTAKLPEFRLAFSVLRRSVQCVGRIESVRYGTLDTWYVYVPFLAS